MKKAGVVLVLLSLGLSIVLAENVTCFKCEGHNADYCQGEEHQCPEGSVCMTISENLGIGKPKHSIRQRCSHNLPCLGNWYTYVNDSIYLEVVSQCCKGNLCNNGTFQEMNRTTEREGPKCPVCFSTDTSEMCKPTSETICRGETDQCATIRARIKTADGVKTGVTGQGCMSATACQFPDYTFAVGLGIIKMYEHVCYLPKAEPQSGTKGE